jgi:putative acetyltransferase
MVFADGAAVGTVALIPGSSGTYELSKMAVSPDLRGLGIGRRLIERAIAYAREIGAASLFLGSSTKLPNAIHLYESVGFRHVEQSSLPGMHYNRADVFMSMQL